MCVRFEPVEERKELVGTPTCTKRWGKKFPWPIDKSAELVASHSLSRLFYWPDLFDAHTMARPDGLSIFAFGVFSGFYRVLPGSLDGRVDRGGPSDRSTKHLNPLSGGRDGREISKSCVCVAFRFSVSIVGTQTTCLLDFFSPRRARLFLLAFESGSKSNPIAFAATCGSPTI